MSDVSGVVSAGWKSGRAGGLEQGLEMPLFHRIPPAGDLRPLVSPVAARDTAPHLFAGDRCLPQSLSTQLGRQVRDCGTHSNAN